MQRLIFHIGIPKTGSSALQVFLARNAKALMAKSVDYLPIGEVALGVAGKISSGNGGHLSRCLFPRGSPGRIDNGERYMQEFFDAVERSTADIGIVSSELFADVSPESLSAVLTRLRYLGVEARCFYYIRDQVQCLASAYVQQVKRHGCTEQPSDYVSRVYKRIGFLKHHTFYRQQCDQFGSTNVLCRVYENAIATDKGLFTAMLSALSISPNGLDFSIKDINTSLSVRELGIMLLLNQFTPRMRFSDMLVENAVQFGSAAAGQIHNFFPRVLVDDIGQYFANENARMARECFLRDDLFAARPDVTEELSEISVDNLSSRDLIAFFGGLLVRYDERLVALEGKLAGKPP
jgi:hypothetical protein